MSKFDEIVNKEFSVSLRGYNKNEVDATFQMLKMEHDNLLEKYNKSKSNTKENKTDLDANVLAETLIEAKKQKEKAIKESETIINNAKAESNRILENAQNTSNKFVSEAEKNSLELIAQTQRDVDAKKQEIELEYAKLKKSKERQIFEINELKEKSIRETQEKQEQIKQKVKSEINEERQAHSLQMQNKLIELEKQLASKKLEHDQKIKKELEDVQKEKQKRLDSVKNEIATLKKEQTLKFNEELNAHAQTIQQYEDYIKECKQIKESIERELALYKSSLTQTLKDLGAIKFSDSKQTTSPKKDVRSTDSKFDEILKHAQAESKNIEKDLLNLK